MAYLYSIIIPHKNIPHLLERCLHSIPQRDDVQIIVVDDNSDPNVVDFNHFPGHDRKDVELIFEKEGKSGGYARNLGLKKAQGRWVMFADADDFFTYCLNDVLDNYKDDSSDMIFFRGCSLDGETYVTSHRADHLNAWIKLYQQKPKQGALRLKYSFGEPWCRLIKRSLIEEHTIRFDETPIHNDTAFAYKAGFAAQTINVDSRSIYCVTTRTSSVSRQATDEAILTRIKVFAEKQAFLDHHHLSVPNDIQYRNLLSLLLRGEFDVFRKALYILKTQGYSSTHILLSSIRMIVLRFFSKITLIRIIGKRKY